MKTVIKSMQSLGMDNFRVAYTRFLAFYSDNPSGLYDGETSAKWQSKVNFASHPSTETEWPPKLLTRFSSWRIELHNDMQESLQVWATFLRFNPLNLAKIVCFAKWVKGAKCVSSDFLNEKVLMILTCIILKITAQLNQLVNWKLWVALFYPEQSVEFWQNLHISQASQVLVRRRKKIRWKKIYRKRISPI